MTAPNHIVGGYTFTGLFGSLLGLNILEDPIYLIIIGVATLLPDIDHTKSIVGKIFYPISYRINRKYGHRTITHSLFFLALISTCIALLEINFFPGFPATKLFSLAYGSHIFLDMMTVRGVPIFYPFYKNPCVIPGDPNKRIKTSNVRHEAVVMCIFIVSAIFLQPLFKNGFWTSYNRLFGTLQHLRSEYDKSEDLLSVKFCAQEGSRIDTITGYAVRVSFTSVTILSDSTFTTYPKEGQRIFDIYPTHTGKSYYFDEKRFNQVSLKELSQLISNKYITNINVFGSRSFQINNSSRTEFELDFPSKIFINEIPHKAPSAYRSNTSIPSLYRQIDFLKNQYAKEIEKYNEDLKIYNAELSAISEMADLVEKEIRMEDLSKVKPPKYPTPKTEKIRSIETRIAELKHKDLIRKNDLLAASVEHPLKLSGTYEVLYITD